MLILLVVLWFKNFVDVFLNYQDNIDIDSRIGAEIFTIAKECTKINKEMFIKRIEAASILK
ncbi:hypothetical protein [Caldicellulosiruptor acetigenus]|uniref:hypothetical protein n=1 Tax=Caldicellulosiruptor acetigenus TaxID=301953 RepID=UPI0001E9C03C